MLEFEPWIVQSVGQTVCWPKQTRSVLLATQWSVPAEFLNDKTSWAPSLEKSK